MKKLDTLPKLKCLKLWKSGINGSVLARLKVIPQLEVLCADELRGFTPAIKKIAESQKMKYLVLRNSEIGLEQMQTLSKCHSIRSLDIKENQEVTDECIAFVPKAVRNLCIIGCSITPKCIPALTKLKDLQSLQISLNGWSNEDLQRLRNALPETVIRP